jgi:hypothetical protein
MGVWYFDVMREGVDCIGVWHGVSVTLYIPTCLVFQ